MTKMRYSSHARVEVTKEFIFDSAHFLEDYDGPCSQLHGHTYKLHITVKGTMNNIGMVVDFKDLKSIVKERVVDLFDHKCINNVWQYNPTAENMVVFIFTVINDYFRNRQLVETEVVSVKLWETPTSYAEYKGEGIL